MSKPQRLCALARAEKPCGAVALLRDTLCKFHARDRDRADIIARSCTARLRSLRLPAPADTKATAAIAANVSRALDIGKIDRERAKLILYALQINRSLRG